MICTTVPREVGDLPRKAQLHGGTHHHHAHEDYFVNTGAFLAEEIFHSLGAVVAPAQHRGIGEQEERDGNELGAKAAKGCGERLTHQRVVLHACQHAAALNVHHAGGQDDQCRDGADHNGIRKHLKHAPHALMHRLLDVGGELTMTAEPRPASLEKAPRLKPQVRLWLMP